MGKTLHEMKLLFHFWYFTFGVIPFGRCKDRVKYVFQVFPLFLCRLEKFSYLCNRLQHIHAHYCDIDISATETKSL